MAGYQKYVVLCGTLMINSVLCVTLYFGNLSSYIYSLHYIRQHPSGRFDIDPSWMLPMCLLSSSVSIFTVDTFRHKVGLHLTHFLGVILFISSFFISYFTVTHSIWALTLTFMVVGGVGNGLTTTCGMVYLAGWFGTKMGLATGLHKASAAIGGIAINMLLTAYINPHNLTPDASRGELHLFSQPEVLDRVPTAFLIVGGVCTIIQFTGILLLKAPKLQSQAEENLQLLHDNSAVKTKENQSDPIKQLNNENVEKPPADISNSIIAQPDLQKNLTRKDQRDNTMKSEIAQETRDQQCVSGYEENTHCYVFSPKDVLRCEKFYVLECAVMSLAMGMIVVSNYSKLFGEIGIKDDQFLAFVSSSACFSSIFFLIVGGSLVDLFGLKNTLIAHLALCSIFLSLWYVTVELSRWVYMIWTMFLYSIHFNQNVLVTVSALEMFGKPHFATNLGLIQIARVMAYLLSPPLMALALSTLGWFWMFFINGCLSFLSQVLITIRLPPDQLNYPAGLE